ncbi:alpha/beta hydrolase [Winogradskyella litorisediminis]|uniref:Alpha/beta hydrolase n=1 Tax=Winogradskyella litorisediminis TaxID=1156618 RepID=A0ABW3NBJ8_9FLAO
MNRKEVTYSSKNTYETLNKLSASTKNIWLVFHGMGYLSKYFLRYFKDLNADENYIIALEAPSKYYIQPKMHVGANWLTRENTEMGMHNILNYLDAVLENETVPLDKNLIIFGYSQGVSIASRYVVKRQLQPLQLVLHSGGIPKELTADDFKFLNSDCKVKLIYGTEDEYLDEARIKIERQRAENLFGNRLDILPFDGKHVVNVDYINNLV